MKTTMTKLKIPLTLTAIASILMIGSFAAVPDAYSTYGGWGGNDDDCDDYYGYHHDDCDEEQPQTGKIVVRKAITNDNGGDATPEDFTIKITNTKTGEEIILEHDHEDPSMNVNEVPAGTYKMSETIADSVTGTYTTVLITGDKKCPSMVDEKFKIKQGKKIECTIYNDDNGDGSSGEPGAGVVFRPTSVTITPGTITNFALPDNEGNVMIDASGDSVIIIDPEFQEPDAQNLIVIFTIIDPSDSGNPIQCFSEGIVDAGGSNGFRIACAEALEASQYILNYALIKTIVLAAV